MYPVSENTNPNATLNPTFELAYWRFGLDIAIKWKERQGKAIPKDWTRVRDELAPLPITNGTYPIYEGIPNMWVDNTTTSDVSHIDHSLGLPVFSVSNRILCSIQQWRASTAGFHPP